jgi:hypothetical protein
MRENQSKKNNGEIYSSLARTNNSDPTHYRDGTAVAHVTSAQRILPPRLRAQRKAVRRILFSDVRENGKRQEKRGWGICLSPFAVAAGLPHRIGGKRVNLNNVFTSSGGDFACAEIMDVYTYQFL